MQTLKILNFENATEAEIENFELREAVRAVIFDNDGKIALLKSGEVYKNPGGGIETGESFEEALVRECQEEAGCRIKILGELGIVTELKKEVNFKQNSYGYLAQVLGEKGTPAFTDSEIERGFKLTWLDPHEALKNIENISTTDYHAKYILAREYALIKAGLDKK